MITLLKKLAIFRCRTRQTYVLLFLGVAFVFVSTIIGSFIFRPPPLLHHVVPISLPILVYFVLLIRHSGMDLNIINFLKEDIYMKQELVTLGALTKCVLLNFLYVSVFFLFCMSLLFNCRRKYKQLHTSGSVHVWWCYIQE